ncbi:MAG: methyltransferase domain-containing protein [Elusimicrobia bacterium]|nr:methyltransferase domain-containing protein [Elusimicrobiota bacterium]
MNRLTPVADSGVIGRWAHYFRLRRFALFRSLLETLDKPIRILDVGGTETFWERMGFSAERGVSIVLLNHTERSVARPGLTSVKGDARSMPQYQDGEFDVVFSNSVIEHVGGPEKRRSMASEIRRVGKRYFVQTPNKHFPIEPHFMFPFFQFLPLKARARLLLSFDLGSFRSTSDKRAALRKVKSIDLLTEAELRRLFPEAAIVKEKFLGLTKSFLVYGGWRRRT